VWVIPYACDERCGYTVLWVVPAMTKSSCRIDVTFFPFDEQRCPLKFGSWTYDGFQMDLLNLNSSGDLSKYTTSGEWDLVGMPAVRYIRQLQQQQPFYGPFVRDYPGEPVYQKKHSPTHHPDHQPIFISFFHLPRSTASSLFKLRAWQSFCTTSFHVLLGLPLGLEPSTSYSIHFFTQSVSSFRRTCPYHRDLFCCNYCVVYDCLHKAK